MTDLASAAEAVRKWTKERDRRIQRARDAGMSLRAIAEQAGLSHGGVAKILARSESAP